MFGFHRNRYQRAPLREELEQEGIALARDITFVTDEEGAVLYEGQAFSSWEEAEQLLDVCAKPRKFQWTNNSSCSIASANETF